VGVNVNHEHHSNTYLFFFALLVISALLIPAVSAITISFVDTSYLGDNPVTITDETGTMAWNGTTGSSAAKGIVLNDSHAYWIRFEPGGIADLAKNPDTAVVKIGEYAPQVAVGLFFFLIVLWVIFGRR
jgi:hypothetical protein